MNSSPLDPVPANRPHGRAITGLRVTVILVIVYIAICYLILPESWKHVKHHHPALVDAPTITHTKTGIPGDPLNVALVGSKQQVVKAMLAAGWYAANPITLKSSLRIAGDTVLHRPYDEAPVSNLYLWNRKEDLAFEQPIGNDPRRRHHVRFWMAPQLDDQGRPLWIGAATLDTHVGFSHTTGEITHHIGPDVDAERDKVIADLLQAKMLDSTYWEDAFHTKLDGRNGGGDSYNTDGRLEVGLLVADTNPQSVESEKMPQSDEGDRSQNLLNGADHE